MLNKIKEHFISQSFNENRSPKRFIVPQKGELVKILFDFEEKIAAAELSQELKERGLTVELIAFSPVKVKEATAFPCLRLNAFCFLQLIGEQKSVRLKVGQGGVLIDMTRKEGFAQNYFIANDTAEYKIGINKTFDTRLYDFCFDFKQEAHLIEKFVELIKQMRLLNMQEGEKKREDQIA